MKRGTLPLFAVLFGMAVAGASPVQAAETEFWVGAPRTDRLTHSEPGFSSAYLYYDWDGPGGSAAYWKWQDGGQFAGNFWDSSPTAITFLRMFCSQLLQYAPGTTEYYQSQLPNNDNLRKLYDKYYPYKEAGDFWNGTANTNFGDFDTKYGTSTTMDTAFQLAVWEILFDSGLDLSSGSFQASNSTIKTQAQTMLNDVVAYGTGTGYTQWTLYNFYNETHQDFISATYNPSGDIPTPTPEPGTLALLGLGLAGLAAARRRKQ